MFGDLFRAKRSFASADELFEVVRSLIAEMRANGQTGAAKELDDGFRCLNGLTDGWGLFLESIDAVLRRSFEDLTASQGATLADIRAAVHRAIHRR